MSKIGLNRLTELQAKALSDDASRPGILVNSVSTIMSYVVYLYYGYDNIEICLRSAIMVAIFSIFDGLMLSFFFALL